MPPEYVELYERCCRHNPDRRPEIKEDLEVLNKIDENLKIFSEYVENSEKSLKTKRTKGIDESLTDYYFKIKQFTISMIRMTRSH
ncbi:hypothetical protein F8M41_001453 [Gigaspora margarita]|uniref:Uncharacterized protein n=1 Tax=Gigaspora margarita TaxID=4874 RepID=A0A8H4A843_GIGMA|nr:hypothetical protein F8M41_001453 [Gigaspora margarita]